MHTHVCGIYKREYNTVDWR